MTFRSLSAVRSGSLILLFVGVLAATTLSVSESAYALEETGRELGHQEGSGGGSGLELTNPGDDDQPTIRKRRPRVVISSAEVPQGDTANAPERVPANGAEHVHMVPVGIWVRIAFDLWLGMLR